MCGGSYECVRREHEAIDSPSGTYFSKADDNRDGLYEIELSDRDKNFFTKIRLKDLKITLRQEVNGKYRDLCYLEGGEKVIAGGGPAFPFAEIILQAAPEYDDGKGPGVMVRFADADPIDAEWEDEVDILAISCGI